MSLTTISLGLCLRMMVVGSRDRLSRTVGRKGSMRMSVWGRRERRREWEAGDLRSMQMEDLYVVRRSGVGGGRGFGYVVVGGDGDGGIGFD